MELGDMVAQSVVVAFAYFHHICADIYWMLPKHMQVIWIGDIFVCP